MRNWISPTSTVIPHFQPPEGYYTRQCHWIRKRLLVRSCRFSRKLSQNRNLSPHSQMGSRPLTRSLRLGHLSTRLAKRGYKKMNAQLQTQAKAHTKCSHLSAPSGLLQRKCACGNHTIADGECAECRKKSSWVCKPNSRLTSRGISTNGKRTGLPIRCMAAPQIRVSVAHHPAFSASRDNRPGRWMRRPPAWSKPLPVPAGRWSRRCGRTWSSASATIFPGCGCIPARPPSNRRGT